MSFDLLVDSGREIARAYGAVKENGSSIQRTVVIVDCDGKVQFLEEGAPSAEALLRALDGMK